jgi:hypothetical protein
MSKKKILFIGGSLNQTTMVHAVSRPLSWDYDCYFTPYYCDGGLLARMARAGWLDFTVIGGQFRARTEAYLRENGLEVDYGGRSHDYDLVVTTSDLVVQENIRHKTVVLIQEGMTDPENLVYHLVRWFRLPRYLASTSTTGLSDAYQAFCVASEGYRQLFVRKGARPEKLVVTGIPNFDNAAQYLDNDFPYRGYVLAATSDARETFKFDNRRAFLRWVGQTAAGRQIIFKLHPNEKVERAQREIQACLPGALVFTAGNVNHMIANCEVLITQYSSVVYTGIALGKEVHSYFDVGILAELAPLQNGGRSAHNIAKVCQGLLEADHVPQRAIPAPVRLREPAVTLA